MNRNILFRGKNTEFNTWEYGSLVFDYMNQGYILKSSKLEKDGHHLIHNSDDPIDFDQSSFGQDTLITDWKGAHCFEHDIIKIIPQGNWESGTTPWIGVVVFKNSTPMLLIDKNDGSEFELMRLNPALYMRFEVVGNIFDNEELISNKMLQALYINWL